MSEIECPCTCHTIDKCLRCNRSGSNNGFMIGIENEKYCLTCWKFEVQYGKYQGRGFRYW